MPKKTERIAPRAPAAAEKLSTLMFDCEGTWIQACNGYLSIWLGGDFQHEANLEISMELLKKIIAVAEQNGMGE